MKTDKAIIKDLPDKTELRVHCHRHKMAKHFHLDITDTSFSFARKDDAIAAEAARDGLYVIRTNLPAETIDDPATVRSYKSLARVERAFRCLKTVDFHIRPVYHWLEGRGRAHVLLCMLAIISAIRDHDPPPKRWTPLISFFGSRKVFDGNSASSIYR